MNKDNISEDLFLFPELDKINNDLINSKIYMIKYEGGGKESTYSRGKILEINKYEFVYMPSKGYNSSGNLIFLENSVNVLGFDKIDKEDKSKNYGIFISHIIDKIRNDKRKKRNNELQSAPYEEKEEKKPIMILEPKNSKDCYESNEQFDDREFVNPLENETYIESKKDGLREMWRTHIISYPRDLASRAFLAFRGFA